LTEFFALSLDLLYACSCKDRLLLLLALNSVYSALNLTEAMRLLFLRLFYLPQGVFELLKPWFVVLKQLSLQISEDYHKLIHVADSLVCKR